MGPLRTMQSPLGSRILRLGTLGAVALLSSTGCLRKSQVAEAKPAPQMHEGKDPEITTTTRPSAVFMLDGKPLCFAGTNNYYLTFKSQRMADDVLIQARGMGLRVMRTWGFIDRGALDGSVPSVDGDGTKDGVYFQYWDAKAGRPGYNEGADGLPRLDYVLFKAGELGLKVIVVLTNNWTAFGGMDQYVAWYGLKRHTDFYTDPKVRAAYKDWVTYLVNRVNTVTGKPYRDDPAIFAWELANEPRCKNYGKFDSREGWDHTTITKWADEMSAYIHSIDPNHLVSVGDEGFFHGGNKSWSYGQGGGNDGVDHEALLGLRGIDFGTYHLYPDDWGYPWRWGHEWIEDHILVAQKLGKPTILEEYGIRIRKGPEGSQRRQRAYKIYNDTVIRQGGQASMFWILSGVDDAGGNYGDYDGFTVYNPSPDAALLQGYAARIQTEARACQLAAGAQPPAGKANSAFVIVVPPPNPG